MDVLFTLSQIKAAAATFLSVVKNHNVVALHGEMGAGKTTFVHAVCDELGVQNAVGSPTFSIINEYTTAAGKLIYHLDLYRLKSVQEAIDAGVEDCFFSGNLCLVEWPEIAPLLFPDDTVHCYLKVTGNNERNLVIG
jgi:tRNA threonylcarbamoyladenosine biosynthesis protein TsaE